ncbi:helix-turn-helix transcriptional regulator [Vibrio sp. TRT 2004]|uniref:helix-turn-helix transcriptional regulator n=1 Tax=Vibrio sp. TRT 2004 TaxID=3418506 RepID=UPI003CEEF63C
MKQNTNNIDRIIRETERLHLTSISRSHAWVLEQKGQFPKRIKLGNRSVGWKLSQILAWIEQQGEEDE